MLIVFHGVGQSASQAAAFRHAHKVIDWEMTLVECWPRKPQAPVGLAIQIGRRVPLFCIIRQSWKQGEARPGYYKTEDCIHLSGKTGSAY